LIPEEMTMMTNDLMDPKTVAKINRLTAAEVTVLARQLFKDDRIYAQTYRGRRDIVRLLSPFQIEYVGISHRVRTGHPGNWVEALLNGLRKEGGR
jgi:hypothetical protein